MNTLISSFAASAVLLGLACSPSSAKVVGDDSFIFSTGTTTVNFAGTTAKTFSDTFTLTLQADGDTSVGFNSQYSGKGQPSTKYTTFSLSNGTNTYSDLNIVNTKTQSTGQITIADLMAGTYTLTIGGTAAASNGKFPNYGGTISVTSVPLPPALPMFGAALLGLGAVGYSMKRKNDGQAVTAAV